jgi:hypothetical protein
MEIYHNRWKSITEALPSLEKYHITDGIISHSMEKYHIRWKDITLGTGKVSHFGGKVSLKIDGII